MATEPEGGEISFVSICSNWLGPKVKQPHERAPLQTQALQRPSPGGLGDGGRERTAGPPSQRGRPPAAPAPVQPGMRPLSTEVRRGLPHPQSGALLGVPGPAQLREGSGPASLASEGLVLPPMTVTLITLVISCKMTCDRNDPCRRTAERSPEHLSQTPHQVPLLVTVLAPVDEQSPSTDTGAQSRDRPLPEPQTAGGAARAWTQQRDRRTHSTEGQPSLPTQPEGFCLPTGHKRHGLRDSAGLPRVPPPPVPGARSPESRSCFHSSVQPRRMRPPPPETGPPARLSPRPVHSVCLPGSRANPTGGGPSFTLV